MACTATRFAASAANRSTNTKCFDRLGRHDPGGLRYTPRTPKGILMDDIYSARRKAADKALAEHDFEPSMVTDPRPWNTSDDRHNEWTCVLSMDDEDCHPYTCGFIVRFHQGTDIIREAYPGDPH